MKKLLLLFLLLSVLLSSCEPMDDPTVYAPPTPLPFFASETPPPFIVPVTETPVILPPDSETPEFIVPVVETLPVASPTRWWDVYFTNPLVINDPNNPVGSVEEKLIQLINDAQSSIHIASFEFSLTRVAEALVAAKNRGVDVKWMTDDKNGLSYDTQPGRGQFSMLTGAGIEVKDDARSALMHNKFWIFDQQIVWTGSTNVTVNGVYKQNNNVIVVRSPEIALIYEREFQEMWNGQFGPRAPSTVNNQWAILDGTPVQVLFTPEDKAMSKMIAVVADAQTSIRFLAFSFTDFPLAQVMIDRAKTGVDVRGVFETFGSSSPNSELQTLWCAGLPVRQDGNPSFLHHKVIIVDESIVLTGSMNYSANAEESNEENVIIMDNAEIAALYLQEFETVWSQTQSMAAGAFTCP
ncbi:MAG: phospholipase D-like domain-containing protein [Anaerolineales bacterium]|jgi:phosphatidylserine/phosphatidylglycerophosphate/cardiolipin synthase-like enzyme|nr:phospholipase D-like domain-containing protein [Anaerolineales bacterium]